MKRGIAIAIMPLALALAATAPASKGPAGPGAPPVTFTGTSKPGKVRLAFYSTTGIHDNGPPEIVGFRMAHVCTAKGYAIHPSLLVRADRTFRLHTKAFDFTGRFHGPREHPSRVTGTWRVHTSGCSSGPWAFTVKYRG